MKQDMISGQDIVILMLVILQELIIVQDTIILLLDKQQEQELKSAALAKTEMSNQETREMRPRSRSRLSMKLAKFSKPKKDKDGKTPTTPSAEDGHEDEESMITSQDCLNGNATPSSIASTPLGHAQMIEASAVEETIDSTNDNDRVARRSRTSVTSEADLAEQKVKRRSRLGTFLNPDSSASDLSSTVPSSQPSPNVINFHSPNRSTPSSAALLPPFNYSPPVTSGLPTPAQGQGQPATN